MSQTTRAFVIGQGGLRGTVEHPGRLGFPAGSRVEVRLDDGRRVIVPAEVLAPRDDGTYSLTLGPDDLDQIQAEADGGVRETMIVPVVAEELDVQKRQFETGRVRVTKVIREREEVVDKPLLRDEVDVERVPVNRLAEGEVSVRYEGDTIVVPLVEEVLVVEKRLMVREELRITKRRVEERKPQRVTLRAEEARIERIETPEHQTP